MKRPCPVEASLLQSSPPQIIGFFSNIKQAEIIVAYPNNPTN
jgi:hypothetical protein